jgi:glycogen synthase
MSLHSLMFGWEYPPLHLGGLGVACQGLVQGLLRNGIQVTLVLPHPNSDAEGEVTVLSPDGTTQTTIRIRSALRPYDTPGVYNMRLAGIPREHLDIYGGDLAAAIEEYTAASIEITRDVQPSVVHCHDWMTYEAGIRAASHHRCPLVTHIHATEFDRTHFHPNPWIADFELRGFLAADRIIAVSRYTKQILMEHYGIPADKIAVVHNGTSEHLIPQVDALQSSARLARHPIVLFLGRLVLQKGPRQFLDMAAAVHRHRQDAQFVMAGDGHMLPELMEYAVHLGLGDAVVFTGKVSSREVSALYKAASCFVMPSLSEPFGLVALEAAAHGTPVILSKQSGVAEVLDHAFHVDFWDTEKMADCVLTILREQPLAEQLRSEAPRVLSHLTWQKQAGIVRSIYEQLTQS